LENTKDDQKMSASKIIVSRDFERRLIQTSHFAGYKIVAFQNLVNFCEVQIIGETIVKIQRHQPHSNVSYICNKIEPQPRSLDDLLNSSIGRSISDLSVRERYLSLTIESRIVISMAILDSGSQLPALAFWELDPSGEELLFLGDLLEPGSL
jgi:hypothetical protein